MRARIWQSSRDVIGSIPRVRPRVLMLTHCLPYPPDHGDRIRSFHMLRVLSNHFDISLACTNDQRVSEGHLAVLGELANPIAVEVVSEHICHLRAGMGLLGGKAGTCSAFYRRSLAHTVQRWHRHQPFDAVLTFCTGMLGYARLLTSRREGSLASRHILDLVDVDSLKWRQHAKMASGPRRWACWLEARRLRKVESGRFDRFDAISVVSEAEAADYRRYVGDHPNLFVAGNGVDSDHFGPMPDAGGRTLCFVGELNYPPNTQAATWFVHNVLPRLRQRLSDVRFQIVGRHSSPAVRELANQAGVEVVGEVDDLRKALARSTAVVAPLQMARGIQNKVLEAMASQRVVVCSPAAFTGIDAQLGRDVLLAREPQQWTDLLEHVLVDEAFRRRLAEAARRHVMRRYGWAQALEPMARVLGAQAHPPIRRAG